MYSTHWENPTPRDSFNWPENNNVHYLSEMEVCAGLLVIKGARVGNTEFDSIHYCSSFSKVNFNISNGNT